MNQADIILKEREKKGLILSISLRIFFLITVSLAHLHTHHSVGEIVRTVFISFIFLIVLSAFIYYVKKDKYFRFIGYASLSVDIFLLLFFPYNWYDSVGFYENVPSTYLLKTSLPPMAVIFVCISALAIRPMYPLIVSFFFNLIWIYFFYLVYQDPRTEFTDSFIDNFFSPKIIPGYYAIFSLTTTFPAILISWITHSYRKSIKQAVQYELQNGQMSRYFSPGILKEIKNDESIFQAKSTQVVVMFVDIRGFTSLSGSMNAEQVVQFLREYHSMMVGVIYSEGGTIDKFLGDGIMVSFGTPTPSSQDAIHAIRCALKMRQALAQWNQERAVNGLKIIHQGIGIHYGPVVSGNIGSKDRLEYTVIGDTVNVASRIESLCKNHGVDVLVSKSLLEKYEEEGEVSYYSNFESIGEVTIRGKVDKIELFKLKDK